LIAEKDSQGELVLFNSLGQCEFKKSFEELQSLSYVKPFGEGAFIGWKRVAFINGLI
jgi:hypothetical protein